MTQEILEKVSEEQLVREETRMRENWQRLQLTREKVAHKKGLAQGMERGLERGRQEGRQEGVEQVAAAMKRKGIGHTEIVEITGLPLEVIKAL